MIKVHIHAKCEHCNGEAHLPKGEAESYIKEILCSHEHTSFQGGFHFTAGDVWDDITEVCDDCGANLDKQ